VISPKPPRGLASFTAGLPRLLRNGGADGAWVEEKGLAVAVHTRRLEDPKAAYERLLPLLEESAKSHDLDVEPGRNVIEIRAHGMHKGAAVHRLVEELDAKAVAFVGDDLGDVEAFRAVEELRREGYPGLLVCSASEEENALSELADVVVRGPAGVLELLRELTGDIRSARA
jgi:trehalose 6-phosphate phosphatase